MSLAGGDDGGHHVGVSSTAKDRTDAGPPAAQTTSDIDAQTTETQPDTEPRPPQPTRVERLIGWLLPDSNPAGAIYGMIAIGALLAAESGLHDSYAETVGSALVALALYWLAHAYAELLGRRWHTRERLTAAALGRALARDWAIMRGATAALVALVVCWAVGAEQETGVTVAIWTTAVGLVAYEVAAGVRARSRPAELLLEGCVGAAMGVGVLTLRVILH